MDLDILGLKTNGVQEQEFPNITIIIDTKKDSSSDAKISSFLAFLVGEILAFHGGYWWLEHTIEIWKEIVEIMDNLHFSI